MKFGDRGNATCYSQQPDMPADASRDERVIERYRARYRVQDAAFRALDTVAHPFSTNISNQAPVDKSSITKILVVNCGHIGDVVISTALLTLLKRAIPNVNIGFLTGTYSKKVVEQHPY